jgi:hypothetical protein
MPQTVSFAASTNPLALNPVWRSSPFVLTGTPIEGVTTYRAQLWRRPQAARLEDAVALASSYATVVDSSVSLGFSGTQMDFALAAGGGEYDDVWLTLAGVQADGQLVPLRADWLRVTEAGCDPEAFVVGGIQVTVVDNVATWTVGSVTFQTPVWQEPDVVPGEGGWAVSIVDSHVILTKNGVSFATTAFRQ